MNSPIDELQPGRPDSHQCIPRKYFGNRFTIDPHDYRIHSWFTPRLEEVEEQVLAVAGIEITRVALD